jgi:hypothetical protein
MFKVKDKVEFTTLEYKESVCNNNWKEVKLNTEYEISFVGYYDFGYGKETAVSLRDIGYTGFIPAAILKLSKAKTTLNKDTVKVGQKVRVIESSAINLGFTYTSNNCCSILKKGYEGTITGIEPGLTNASKEHVWVFVDNNGGIGTMLLELLEEPKSEQESLLEEAKRRYPIGTKYYVAHLNGKDAYYEDIVDSHDFSYTKHSITLEGSTFKNWARCVYHEGKWAGIVANTSEEFKVGDWVTVLDTNIGSPGAIDTFRKNGFTGKVGRVITTSSSYPYNVNGIWSKVRKATSEEIAEAQRLMTQLASESLDMEKILRICKDNYPVGTTYECACYSQSFTVDEQSFKINGTSIYGENGKGCLFYEGKYAEILYKHQSIDSEEYPMFAKPKKEKYVFSEVEYLAKPINQQLDLPIVKKYKKKSIINL